MGGKRWTKQEDSLIIKLNKQGMDYAQIVKQLPNRTKSSCNQRGIFLGLKNDNNVNKKFFERDDEEKHYILGYWLADGCISYKSGGYYFNIVSKDKEHLEKMSKIMNIKTPIGVHSKSTFQLNVGNKALVESLISIGGQYRKSRTIKIQDLEFNPKYFNHLLRGYFDGDGGFQWQSYVKNNGEKSLSTIRFTGCSNIINSMYEYIGIKGSIYKDNRKNNCLYLAYSGKEMRFLADYMYKENTISLTRKYKDYLKYRNW